jgi:hypothetical protein
LSEPPVGGEFLFFRRRHSHLGEHSTPWPFASFVSRQKRSPRAGDRGAKQTYRFYRSFLSSGGQEMAGISGCRGFKSSRTGATDHRFSLLAVLWIRFLTSDITIPLQSVS